MLNHRFKNIRSQLNNYVFTDNPRSLLHQCRLKIRSAISIQDLRHNETFQSLPVPEPLRRYLTYDDVKLWPDTSALPWSRDDVSTWNFEILVQLKQWQGINREVNKNTYNTLLPIFIQTTVKINTLFQLLTTRCQRKATI